MKRPCAFLLSAAMWLAAAAAAVFPACSCNPLPEVYDLRCEGLQEPLGIDSPLPRFSWKIRCGKPVEQAAYEIQAAGSPGLLDSGTPDLWTSGKVESADQVMVPYGGQPLQTRTLAWWRVRVFSSDGTASPWSEPQRFGTGVFDGTMAGSYIGAVPGEGRCSAVRGSFTLDSVPPVALLHVNSLGYHEASINGSKVSDDVLCPAVSQLDRHSLINTYDVTGLLREGVNEIRLDLGRGWYRPSTFGAAYDGPLVKAELDGYFTEGAGLLLCTGPGWEGSWNGRRDLGTWTPHRFGGEEIDAGAQEDWGPVDVIEIPGMSASPQMCLPTRILEEIRPVSIEPLGEGSWMVDFGRIVNAVAEVRLPSLPAGHVTTATFSDFRHEDGSLEEATQGFDRYVSSGNPGGDLFQNRFNHHLFRYMRIDSLPVEPRVDGICAKRIGYAAPRTASFRSSDEELNRIHDLVAGTLDNLVFGGYMVDCASIERLGYGGDGNASTLTLQILRDAGPLYRNWLRAWAEAQRPDGGLPHTAPNPYTAGGGPYWCSFLVQAPWRTYMSYGDAGPALQYYGHMLHWLDYVDAHTVDGLLMPWPDTDYRGWYLGDWAAPQGVDVRDSSSVTLVNNCALCQVFLDMEKMAVLLGKASDAAAFHRRCEALASRIHETFFHPEDATYASGSQIDMAYPLLVGAVPRELRGKVRDRLMERTASVYGGHLATGLAGVAVVTEWATLARECDWIYGMLKQRSYPGYLFMLDQGATGVWEEWDGGRSHLHNCYNGIGSWFYQALGGIIPEEAGYRRVLIDPQIPEGLRWVRVSQETPCGTIVVKRNGAKLHIEIPAGITATVRGREYTCGKYNLKL
ncbi:MAG: glycoside hydrolase family 78 protein [Bacteroidales bacterium]|nr:glycoside hydrolase family 78 protein [Bacteroidales bacterium]